MTKDIREWFFSLGEKVTKGDPKRLFDWNYYMLWIMFVAFVSILIGNSLEFIKSQRLANLGWSFVILAILWFQFQSLKQTYEARKMFKEQKPEKIEGVDEMLKEFKQQKEKNGRPNKMSKV